MLPRQHTAMFAAGCSVLVLTTPAPAGPTSGYDGADPAGWSDRRLAAPGGVQQFVASDEEGGRVQRLGGLIHPLPSAKAMGRWSLGRVRAVGRRYAVRMRALGVRMDLAPVADLAE